MDKQIVVYSHNRILLNSKKEKSPDTLNDVNESHRYYAEGKKLDTNGHILHSFTHKKLQKKDLIYSDRK